jgi:hypothetical protein
MKPLAFLMLTAAALMAQTRGGPIQETVDPGAPLTGYGTCWFDVTTHTFSCRSATNVLYLDGAAAFCTAQQNFQDGLE